jgi:hypothetical protein
VRRWEIVCALAILAAQAATLVSLAKRTGVTVDEPAHLLSSNLYWHGEDNLHPRDMPPLIKIVGGAVTSRLPFPIPRDNQQLWSSRDEWSIAQEMLARMSRDQIETWVFRSRLPLIAFPLLCSLALWIWARRLFPPLPAMIVLALFVSSPIVLGHGALFKNDLSATLGYLLFWFALWRWWQSLSMRSAAAVGGALLVALLAKLSMLVLVPITGIVMAARRPGWRVTVSSIALAFSIAYAGNLAGWQFDTRRLQPGDFETCLADDSLPGWVCYAAAPFRVFPVAQPMWIGSLNLFRANTHAADIYMLGEIYHDGHPAYFLLALAVKMAAPALVLFLMGMTVLAIRAWRRELSARDCLWIIPPFLYVGLASLSAFTLGVRLVLPALPFLLLIAGAGLNALPLKLRHAAAVAALVLSLGRSIYAYPNYLSYFNLFVGGPSRGIKYLSDSNLDWGQDLPALRDKYDEMRIPKLRLFYFGTGNPWAYFNDRQLELIPPPWGPEFIKTNRFIPQPGWYAVSATLLTGQFFAPEYQDYFAFFRDRTPTTTAGNSIFIYHIE